MDGPTLLLKYAVEEILQRINKEKLDPQAAVTKVAEDRQLNPNFIKRASEVINVALTYNHFKKHANSKDEDFPIVDAQKVVTDIFGKTEKTAAAKKSEWFSPDTQACPNLNLLLTNDKFASAYAAIASAEAPKEYDLSEKGIYEKSAQYIDRLAKQVDELTIKKAHYKYAYTSAFSAIANGFAKEASARTSFSEFESQAFAKLGTEGLGYVDYIYKAAKIEEPRGVLDSKYTNFTTCKEVELLTSFIDNSDKYAAVVDELATAEDRYKEAKEKVYASYHKYGQAKYGGVPKFTDVDLSLPDVVKVANTAVVKKIAEIVDPVLEKVKAKIQEQQKQEIVAEAMESIEAIEKSSEVQKKSFDFVNSIVNKLTKGPEQKGVVESSGDTLNRRLILENLAQTDPILSSVEPKRLVDAYSQLLHLAPELAKEKEVVRASLRQMVSTQALGPFDAQQLVEANSKLLKQKMTHQGKLEPRDTFGKE